MAATEPSPARAAGGPASNHWADQAAERIIRQRGDREHYVVASGVAPSGSVHFGHLREVMSTELVARALRDRGKQVRFIYSWDDYDVFRKVPVNLPRQEELARHLRKPVVDVPDPFAAADNYAAGFEHSLEQVMPRLGIAPEYLYQAQRYRDCRYADGVRAALAAREQIRGILNRHRERPLGDDYWPITIYSERDGTDNTTVLDWDGGHIVTYRDADGTERQLDLTRSGAAKLLWRVDWPMRWAYEHVDFEPAGKDHLVAGGSFDTGGPISREVYGHEPPVTFLYGDVGVKGGAGRISSSAGNAVTIEQVLAVYQPEVVRYLYAGTRPSAEFVISFDLDVLKIYEDYDQAERVYYGVAEVGAKRRARDSRVYEFSQIAAPAPAMPLQVPFRHLCNLIQIRDGDVDATLAAVAEELGLVGDEHADARRRLAARAHGAAVWLEEYAPPAMRFRLRRPEQPAPELAAAEERALGALYAELAHLDGHDGASLANRIYAIAEQEDLESRALFKAAYRVLLDAERGPRLADFILLSGRERISPLLAPYADRTPAAAAAGGERRGRT
jgi:lysyl-tRNA synthetase class 1